MRPTPRELISGVRDQLRDDVAPHLTSAQALLTLRRVMVVLREGDWDDAGFALMRENEILQALGQEIIDRHGAQPPADLTELGLLAARSCRLNRFHKVAAMNREYREAYAALMEAAPGATDLRSLIVARLASVE